MSPAMAHPLIQRSAYSPQGTLDPRIQDAPSHGLESHLPTPSRRPTSVSDPANPPPISAHGQHRNSLVYPTSTRSRIRASAQAFRNYPPIRIRSDLVPDMSRPSNIPGPTQIPLPSSPHSRSPTGSPLNTPAAAQPLVSPTRNSFLGFMRTRSRTIGGRGATSPSVEAPNPFAIVGSRGGPSRDGPIAASRDAGGVTRSISTPVNSGFADVNGDMAPLSVSPGAESSTVAQLTAAVPSPTYRIRLVPLLESARSLAFDPVIREMHPIIVPPGTTPTAAAAATITITKVRDKTPATLLKIGRFTEKGPNLPVPSGAAAGGSGSGSGDAGGTLGPTPAGPASLARANAASLSARSAQNGTGSAGLVPVMPAVVIAGGGGDLTSNKVAFKSKVVSRSHAEIWCEPGGKFSIRDTASSSGTFLNHIRLSSPNTESRPTSLNDGDVLQLGVDYQGGHEDMFRCVKIRVEIGRDWQRAANEFNTNALKQLKALGGAPSSDGVKGKGVDSSPSVKKARASVTDCCICLFSVTVCQSLFIAPCSHVFHYKCIRPLLMQHHPGFNCPLCRTYANLEEDVETEDAWEIASRRASVISRRPSNHSIRLPQVASSDNILQQAAPIPASSHSSTGIGFGNASASVEELIVGGAESNTASEEGFSLAPIAPPLDRKITAVHYRGARDAAEAEPVDPIQEEDGDFVRIEIPQHVPGLSDDPNLFASLAVLADPSALDNLITGHIAGPSSVLPITVPPESISLSEPGATNGFADTQTPRNDTFLAHLAPGMHQRFDLAQRMNTNGSRGHELVPEESERNAEGGDDEEGERSRTITEDTARSKRKSDAEMMYT